MARINDTARMVGEMEFQNSYRNQLWIGYNGNTGEPIVWQRVWSPETKVWTQFKRATGGNIRKIVKEMNMLFETERAKWLTVDPVRLVALDRAGTGN
jgi:hypothetical protein